MTMYWWDIRMTEKGCIRNFRGTKVDKKFIKEHPWIPRIFYDRHSVAGWDSNYMDPEYTIQFFCDDTDINVILPAAWGMWNNANTYAMEIEALRLYLKEMKTNVNAAIFLKKEAMKRWGEWLGDTENLEEDIVGWEERVDKKLSEWRNR